MATNEQDFLDRIDRLLMPETMAGTGAVIGASMLPFVGAGIDIADIGYGIRNRDPIRASLGLAGLVLPGVTGRTLQAMRAAPEASRASSIRKRFREILGREPADSPRPQQELLKQAADEVDQEIALERAAAKTAETGVDLERELAESMQRQGIASLEESALRTAPGRVIMRAGEEVDDLPQGNLAITPEDVRRQQMERLSRSLDDDQADVLDSGQTFQVPDPVTLEDLELDMRLREEVDSIAAAALKQAGRDEMSGDALEFATQALMLRGLTRPAIVDSMSRVFSDIPTPLLETEIDSAIARTAESMIDVEFFDPRMQEFPRFKERALPVEELGELAADAESVLQRMTPEERLLEAIRRVDEPHLRTEPVVDRTDLELVRGTSGSEIKYKRDKDGRLIGTRKTGKPSKEGTAGLEGTMGVPAAKGLGRDLQGPEMRDRVKEGPPTRGQIIGSEHAAREQRVADVLARLMGDVDPELEGVTRIERPADRGVAGRQRVEYETLPSGEQVRRVFETKAGDAPQEALPIPPVDLEDLGPGDIWAPDRFPKTLMSDSEVFDFVDPKTKGVQRGRRVAAMGQNPMDINAIKNALRQMPEFEGMTNNQVLGVIQRFLGGKGWRHVYRVYNDTSNASGKKAADALVGKVIKTGEAKEALVVPMYFKDGQGGLSMLPQHRGKSTLDLIRSGERTSTSRKRRFPIRVGQVIKAQGSGPNEFELVKVTSDWKSLKDIDQADWSAAEGWGVDAYKTLRDKGYSYFTYERIKPTTRAAQRALERVAPETAARATDDSITNLKTLTKKLWQRGLRPSNAMQAAIKTAVRGGNQAEADALVKVLESSSEQARLANLRGEKFSRELQDVFKLSDFDPPTGPWDLASDESIAELKALTNSLWEQGYQPSDEMQAAIKKAVGTRGPSRDGGTFAEVDSLIRTLRDVEADMALPDIPEAYDAYWREGLGPPEALVDAAEVDIPEAYDAFWREGPDPPEAIEDIFGPVRSYSGNVDPVTGGSSRRTGPRASPLEEVAPETTARAPVIRPTSGAAKGADSYWKEIGEKYGVQTTDFTPEDMTPERIRHAEQFVDASRERLGRSESKNEYVNKLIIRNYYQIVNADGVFAVGYRTSPTTIKGGTAYAVDMALARSGNMPVHFYDQDKQAWFRVVRKNVGAIGEAPIDEFVEVPTPTLTASPALVGSRDLKDVGKKAIEDVYKRSMGVAGDAGMAISQQLADRLLRSEEAGAGVDRLRERLGMLGGRAGRGTGRAQRRRDKDQTDLFE
jgi:hypothetical protein